jgi:putative cardiolipin synthase
LAKAINDAPAALDRLLSERNPRLPIQLNTQNDWSEGERNVPVKFLHDAPGKKYSETGTYNEIIELLKSADDNIVIENPYLIPSREMMKVFKMLTDPNRPSLDANRPPHAVKIRILTNSLKAGASGMLAQAGYESIKKELLDMHIDIWETKDRFIHAKSFAIDDKISIVGSFNTDIRSQKLNTEVALAIFDPEINQELRTSMESHLTESYELDPYGYPMDDRQRYPQTSRKLVGELRLFKLFLPFYKSAL